LKRLRRTGGAGGIVSPNASLTRDEPGTRNSNSESAKPHTRQQNSYYPTVVNIPLRIPVVRIMIKDRHQKESSVASHTFNPSQKVFF